MVKPIGTPAYCRDCKHKVELKDIYSKYYVSGIGEEGNPDSVTYQIGSECFSRKQFPLCVISFKKVISYVTGETQQILYADPCEEKNTGGNCPDFEEK
jgi:hypothetical protein